jgi:hypothetical protein
MASTAHPAAGPEEGWYANPDGPGRRYWDGAGWTEHVDLSDSATYDEAPAPPLWHWPAGIFISLMLPPLGLLAGVLWLVEGGGKRYIGATCASIAVLVLVVWLGTPGVRPI